MASKSSTSKSAALAADEDAHQPKRVVMKPEELEKTAERLYGHSAKKAAERRKEFEAAVEFQHTHNHRTPKRAAEPSPEEAKALERLYSQPIEKKKRSLEAAEKKLASQAPPTKKVSPEDVDQITDRIYSQAMRRKQQSLAEIEKKVYGAQQEEKKLDKEQLKTRVESLFTAAVNKKQEATEKLTEKYRWKIEKKTISKDQAAELANRLSSKK